MSTPAIGKDGTVYFGSHNKKFYALTPDGKEKWCIEVGGLVESSPALGADGTVYFGSSMSPTVFYAVHPNGTIKWSAPSKGDSGSIVSSPAIGKDGTVYATSGVTTAYGDPGETHAETPIEAKNPQNENIHDNMNFIYLIVVTTVIVVLVLLIALKRR